jgi:putative membrane protein
MNRIPSAMAAATIATTVLLGPGKAAVAQGNVDQEFARKAYAINQGEISLGRMAEEKGATPRVRSFGTRMVRDHTAALLDLRVAAGKAQVVLPSTPPGPEGAMDRQLAGLSGKDFDEQYMKHMIAGHGAAISAFTEEIAFGHNPPLRTYARKTLPLLESHETQATQDELRERGHH